MQLRKKNLPYRMQGRTNDLWEHWMTQDIAAYFRLAGGARERKEFLRIANRPVRYLPRNLFQDAQISQEWLLQSLTGRYDLQDIVRKLFFDIERLRKMNPFAAMHYIRKAIGYEDFLTTYAWEQGIEKEELFDVLEEIADTTRTVETFEEWEQQMLQIHALAERNGVRNGRFSGMLNSRAEQNGEPDYLNLMTFHASKGLEFRVVKMPLLFSGRYIAENEGGNGFIKMILDQDDILIGACIIGNPGSEIIFGLAMAITRKLNCAEISKVVFPHPTVGEVFREAALNEA